MLFREIIAAYCGNHSEHIETLRGQNAEVLVLNMAEHIVTICDLPEELSRIL
jgi:hypothetical protein